METTPSNGTVGEEPEFPIVSDVWSIGSMVGFWVAATELNAAI